jgi:hypothetical protein
MPALVPGLLVLFINKKQDPIVECNSIIIPIYFMNLVIYFGNAVISDIHAPVLFFLVEMQWFRVHTSSESLFPLY